MQLSGYNIFGNNSKMKQCKTISPKNLKFTCLIIAYAHLVSSIVTVLSHVTITIFVGLQCDATPEQYDLINWHWLEPILFVLNLGVHGVYPFPLTKAAFMNLSAFVSNPNCYPRYLHVPMLSVFILCLNFLWLKLVTRFVEGVKKDDLKSIRLFAIFSVLNLVVHVSDDLHRETSWIVKVDYFIILAIIIFVFEYARQLQRQQVSLVKHVLTVQQVKQEDVRNEKSAVADSPA